MRGTASLFLAAIVLLAVLGTGCGTSDEEGAPHQPTTPGQGDEATPEMAGTVIGIDVNPSAAPANTATSLGSIETCVSVTSGSTFEVDVFIDAIPSGRDLAGFNYFLKFDNSKLQVNQTDYNMLLASQPGSSVLDAGEQTLPDSDGSLSVVAVDTIGAPSAEPAGSRGVLARYQLQAVGSGTSRLSLEPAPTYLVDSTPDATIAIDEPCPESTTAR